MRSNIFGLIYYKKSLIGNITAWYSLFLSQPAFQENIINTFKILLFSILNMKQSNQVFSRAKIGQWLSWQKFYER